jgi:mRNA deadenylase 3'-5' endonuclease subunit Ccr4
MAMRVIDNKKIDLTDDEWKMYQSIVKSYTTTTNKGEDLFIDLFETNNDGIIIFLKPPSKFRTSFEVFLFLMSIMQHQHLRLMHQQIDDVCSQMKEKLNELNK